MRRFVFTLLYVLGAVHISRFLNRNSLTILLYHGVAPEENRGLPAGTASIYNYRGKFIAPEDFEAQLAYFSRHYTVLELDDAIEKMKSGTLPPCALAITFDDGYRNFYEYAYPILRRYKASATMFLATDFVLRRIPLWVDRLEYAGSKENDSLKRLSDDERKQRIAEIERRSGTSFTDFEEARAVYAPLSLAEIKEMKTSGIRFGAHSRSHPILSRISAERLESEIGEGKRELETAIGPLSRAFAYPNGQEGDWNEEVEHVLQRNGFLAALTTIEGTNTRDTHPLRLRRIAMDATDSTFAFAAIAAGVRVWLRAIKKSYA